jgi:hypothetical protein
MLEPPMQSTWGRLIARLWPDGRTGKDVADTRVTFIAGPPRELLRVLSQRENSELLVSPIDGPEADQKCYSIEEVTDCS